MSKIHSSRISDKLYKQKYKLANIYSCKTYAFKVLLQSLKLPPCHLQLHLKHQNTSRRIERLQNFLWHQMPFKMRISAQSVFYLSVLFIYDMRIYTYPARYICQIIMNCCCFKCHRFLCLNTSYIDDHKNLVTILNPTKITNEIHVKSLKFLPYQTFGKSNG